MKILFAIVDGGGNIPPQLAVARALHSRGVEVRFSVTAAFVNAWKLRAFAFEPFAYGRAIRSHRSAIAGRDHGGVHPCCGGPTDRRVRRRGCPASRRGRRGRRHDSDRGDSRDRGLRHSDGRLRALLLSSGSGPRGQAGRMAVRLRGVDPFGAEHRGVLPVVVPVVISTFRGTPRCATSVSSGRACRRAAAAAVPRIVVSLSTCAFAGERG